MLVSLGRRSSSPGGVELLLECHERIRRFLAMARRLAATTDASPAEIADVATQLHRYFTTALPLHVLDEEQTVARLVMSADAGALDVLARMSADHDAHEPMVDELVMLCESLMCSPARLPELAPLAAELEAALLAHLALEEEAIFPALRALPPAEQATLLDEIRARRA